MKDSGFVKINSVNPLCLIIGETDGYIEESNRNKYLTFASTEKDKKSIRKTYKANKILKLPMLTIGLFLKRMVNTIHKFF